MELLPLSQAAVKLNLSRSLIQALVASGRLHATKVGSYWVVTEAEVERFAKLPRPHGYPAGRPRGAKVAR